MRKFSIYNIITFFLISFSTQCTHALRRLRSACSLRSLFFHLPSCVGHAWLLTCSFLPSCEFWSRMSCFRTSFIHSSIHPWWSDVMSITSFFLFEGGEEGRRREKRGSDLGERVKAKTRDKWSEVKGWVRIITNKWMKAPPPPAAGIDMRSRDTLNKKKWETGSEWTTTSTVVLIYFWVHFWSHISLNHIYI